MLLFIQRKKIFHDTLIGEGRKELVLSFPWRKQLKNIQIGKGAKNIIGQAAASAASPNMKIHSLLMHRTAQIVTKGDQTEGLLPHEGNTDGTVSEKHLLSLKILRHFAGRIKICFRHVFRKRMLGRKGKGSTSKFAIAAAAIEDHRSSNSAIQIFPIVVKAFDKMSFSHSIHLPYSL
jgi:hypothetical protein